VSYKFIDRGIFEILGPTGLSLVSLNIASNLHKMQSGFLYHYTLVILMGGACLLGVRQVWLLFGFFSITVYLSLFLFYSFSSYLEEDKKYD
jgi:membrane protein implicated in regulation of membrane protease activity